MRLQERMSGEPSSTSAAGRAVFGTGAGNVLQSHGLEWSRRGQGAAYARARML